MPKPDFKHEPFRFNRWYASEYNSEAVNIADDFYEADKGCDYALLSAQWLVMNQDGKKIDPVFSVAEILMASKKEGWTPDPRARVINACWLGYVRWKMDIPDVVILPPNPEPPPVIEPEKPKLPEVKVPNPPVAKKPPWKLIATILAAIAFGLKFTPVPAIVIGIVDALVKILQAIPQ